MDNFRQHSNRSPQTTAGKPGIEEYRIAVAQTILERFSLQEIRQKSLENLSRWKDQGTSSGYYDEWTRLMRDGSDTEILTAMTSKDDMASRLRGASPYPGLLDEDTVRRLREMHRGK
ncbi:MAG: hypothetical protein EOP06_00795 [Proteobacteria bacterium]|jgi:hypothetical protein|nr:MAG: hypothetical protein EOP06_00795 [Pseudomonadota bacterium]